MNKPKKGEKMKQLNKNQIILWESQKRAVCKYYKCYDKAGKQYPDCDYSPRPCHLAELQKVIWFINQEKNQ